MPEERIYVISLRKARRSPRNRRTPTAVKLVREFLRRHMKSGEIKLDQKLGSRLWECGAEHPPSKIRVRAVKKENGSVEASVAE
jgi:large subunit ribosomal protein L31e